MKSSVAAAAVVLAASGALAQDMTINTPNSLVQCLPQLLTWSGGQPPYFLTVVPGGQPGASPIVDLGQQTGTSLTWVVNVAQGTSIGLEIRDNTGLTAQSAPVTIQNSSNNTCVGQAAETSAGSGSAGATSGATQGSSTGSGSGSTTTNTGSGSSPTQTRPSTTGSTSGSNTSSGAGAANTNGASNTQLNVAGAIGAAVLAFFV